MARKGLKDCGQGLSHWEVKAARGRGKNITYRSIILCFVFAVLGATLAFARPMMPAETGCRPYERKTAACHAPISKPPATSGYERCCLPNKTKDDWPAGMILGNADFMLTLRHGLSA